MSTSHNNTAHAQELEINQTKIKGRKVVTHNSKSDLPLVAMAKEKLYIHTPSLAFKKVCGMSFVRWSCIFLQ